jgi:hypothetical protein
LLLCQAVVSDFLGVLFCVNKMRNWILKTFQKLLRPDKLTVPTPAKVPEPTRDTPQ